MRSILAACALLALIPSAHAQRIDTRTDDVREEKGVLHCRSHAWRELSFEHKPDGSARHGAWIALDPSFDDRAAFGLDLSPEAGQRFGVRAVVIGARLLNAESYSSATRAVLRYDGVDRVEPLALDSTSSPGILFINARTEDRAQLGTALRQVDEVEIVLFDAKGASVAEFSWDVREFEDATELLLVIGWECRWPVS